jgi:NAD(P)H-hydrate epimerase
MTSGSSHRTRCTFALLAVEDQLPALLPSPEEMAAMDSATIESGILSDELMERAGKAVFEEIRQATKSWKRLPNNWLILCGPGNNGGDGLVIARLALERGVSARTVLCGASRYSPECLRRAEELTNAGGELWIYGEVSGALPVAVKSCSEEKLKKLLSRSGVVVDSLLGTGQKKAPAGVIGQLLSLTADRTELKRMHVGVDIPTGINGDTGEQYDPHFQADKTVAIQLLKRGVAQQPARSSCGELCVVPIGIAELKTSVSMIQSQSLVLPSPPEPTAHKGRYGSVLVGGGSKEMPGAAALSAVAALTSGAGLVTTLQLAGSKNQALPPEVMFLYTKEERESFQYRDADLLTGGSREFHAVLIGPGIGFSEETRGFCRAAWERLADAGIPVVIDADALNCLAADGFDDRSPTCPVLTPHPGEAARLLDMTVSEVQRDRYLAASLIARRYRGVCVLKGASTVVASAEKVAVNLCDTPHLATAGSGDVLAGIVTALIGAGLSPFNAACTATYLHGLSGRIAATRNSGQRFLASSLIDAIPSALAVLRSAINRHRHQQRV